MLSMMGITTCRLSSLMRAIMGSSQPMFTWRPATHRHPQRTMQPRQPTTKHSPEMPEVSRRVNAMRVKKGDGRAWAEKDKGRGNRDVVEGRRGRREKKEEEKKSGGRAEEEGGEMAGRRARE